MSQETNHIEALNAATDAHITEDSLSSYVHQALNNSASFQEAMEKLNGVPEKYIEEKSDTMMVKIAMVVARLRFDMMPILADYTENQQVLAKRDIMETFVQMYTDEPLPIRLMYVVDLLSPQRAMSWLPSLHPDTMLMLKAEAQRIMISHPVLPKPVESHLKHLIADELPFGLRIANRQDGI